MLGGALLFAPGGPGTQPAAAGGLVPFEGCDDLRSWFADAAGAMGPYGPWPGDAPVMEGNQRALASPADCHTHREEPRHHTGAA